MLKGEGRQFVRKKKRETYIARNDRSYICSEKGVREEDMDGHREREGGNKREEKHGREKENAKR